VRPDPETAWLVARFTDQFVRCTWVYAMVGVIWIALGTVMIAVLRD
jgi:hypothetical protein